MLSVVVDGNLIMSECHIEQWLRLSMAAGVGPITALQLVKHWGGIVPLWQASPKAWRDADMSPTLIKALLVDSSAQVKADLKWAQQPRHHIVTLEDPRYPTCLSMIPQPPLLIYVKGDPVVLSKTQVAIIGSRRCSHLGKEQSYGLAQNLARRGIVVTSGLAYGIDAAAHRGALSGNHQTVGVLGSGCDTIYPARHQELADQIQHHGALVSEYSPRQSPKAYHFPQRNRIISGLSWGVVVVEAAQRSGSLITAEHALEQGKEVFAMPGCAGQVSVQGCHNLLKNGAILLDGVEDVMVALQLSGQATALQQSSGVRLSRRRDCKTAPLDRSHRQLLGCVDYKMTTVDQVIPRSRKNVAKVNSMLLILELKGYITRVSGGYVRVN